MWEECMTSKEKYRVKAVTRRQVLEATVAGTALVAAPAFLRHALAADPIKIGIPTVITGGYAILGSQVQRTCRLVKKMTDAKGGVIGRSDRVPFPGHPGRSRDVRTQVAGAG